PGQLADQSAQAGDLDFRPAEVSPGDALWVEQPVQQMQHEPADRQMHECPAKGGHGRHFAVTEAQSHAAQQHRNRQHPDGRQQQCAGRGALVIETVVANLVMQLVQPRDKALAQQQRGGCQGEQQDQPAGVRGQRRQQPPALIQRLQVIDLGQQLGRQTGDPAAVDRRVAGDPEQLVVDGLAQLGTQLLQLILIDLQGDRFPQQGIDMAAELLHQNRPAADQLLQVITQRLALLLRQLVEQAVEVVLLITQLLAQLVDLELLQTHVGHRLGQRAVNAHRRQSQPLLMQDARQQQASLQHADLLVQRAFQLGEVVQLLGGLDVAPGQGADLVGGGQQLFADALVDQ